METLTLRGRDGVELALGVHAPEAPRGGVLLIHGIASHMGWYHPLGVALKERGFATFLLDRRGSGRSGGPRGHMERWGDVVDDLFVAREAISNQCGPAVALHLLGISLGGVFAAAACLRDPAAFRSLTVLSPGFASTVRVPLWRRLRVLRRSFFDPTKLYDLPFGVDQLTDRPEWRRVLGEDPLRTTQVSARFLVQMFRLQRHLRKKFQGVVTPVMALLGGQDAIIDNGEVIRLLQRARTPRVWIEVLEGVSHIIPASLSREDLLDRLTGWWNEGTHIERAEPGVWTTPLRQRSRRSLPDPPHLGGSA